MPSACPKGQTVTITAMAVLQHKKILLGVTGGIAAYKSAILARRLIDAGATVRVVMTQGAMAFMQPLTFQALTGNPVHTELLDPSAEAAMGHIELARWADVILIAPASANTLARLAHGLADDLLGTLCLATDASIVVAPAMNRLMWSNAATVANCQLLESRGVHFIGPDEGVQACGETGAGRLLEPEAIRDQLTHYLQQSSGQKLSMENSGHNPDQNPMAGLKVLITAGPTREAIDPVRFISNRSSGKMGFAIADAAQKMGADVTMIAGPVSLEHKASINRIDVVTAQQMLDAVLSEIDNSDVFISVAAVSDYRMESVQDQKIKKNEEQMQLTLIKNPDILKTVAAMTNKPFCVGFAAETQDVKKHALGKLERKNLDMIAANHVAQSGNPVFGSDTNALDVFWKDNNNAGHKHIGSGPKSQIAKELLALVTHRLKEQPARHKQGIKSKTISL